ncbi:MAG: response regulator [Stappiaceae bacterium]
MQDKQAIDLSDIRVLVAESNPRTRYILAALLSGYGIGEVDEVADGPCAIATYKDTDHDIIIADWDMPGSTGLDLARTIRRSQMPTRQTVPIILITAHSDQRRLDEARDAGITEILSKPISAKDLYVRLTNVIMDPKDTIKTGTFVGPDRRRFHRSEMICD